MICAAVPLLLWSTLYDQSAARVLQARLASQDVSYIVVAAEDGRTVASRWAAAERAVPVGSLVKPFVATAMRSDTRRRCRPEECWLRRGHGEIGLTEALAHSCNSYFLEAAAEIDPDSVVDVVARFGLQAPKDHSAQTLVGLGRNWPVQPRALIEGFRLLLRDKSRPEIRAGMRFASVEGTARLLGVEALAKTGTAPCSDGSRAGGDGFAFAAWPADQPRYLVLVRVHNTTGSNAARTAGEVIRALRDGR